MGYIGHRMSENAALAYENGEMPLSKWTKEEIIFAIEEKIDDGELNLKCDIELLKKMYVKTLKGVALRMSSWHHTGSYYNQTDFYEINEYRLEALTNERILEIIEEDKLEKKNAKSKAAVPEERWRCQFLEWSGTRNHPKATEHVEEGIVKGDWFFRKDGSRKKTSANGFRFIERLD